MVTTNATQQRVNPCAEEPCGSCSPAYTHAQAYREELAKMDIPYEPNRAVANRATTLEQFDLITRDFNRYDTTQKKALHISDGRIDLLSRNIYEDRPVYGADGTIKRTRPFLVDREIVSANNLSEDWALEGASQYFAEGTITHAGHLLGLKAAHLAQYLDFVDQYNTFPPLERMTSGNQLYSIRTTQGVLAVDAMQRAKWAGLKAYQIPHEIREASVQGSHGLIRSALQAASNGNIDQSCSLFTSAYRGMSYIGGSFTMDVDEEQSISDFDEAVQLAQESLLRSAGAFRPQEKRAAREKAARFYERMHGVTNKKVTPIPQVVALIDHARLERNEEERKMLAQLTH